MPVHGIPVSLNFNFKKKQIIMEAKKIREFLGNLTDHEYRFIRIQISLANDARKIISDFNVSKERFCELIELDLSDYDAYVKGGFEYTVDKMALLNAAFCTLKAEQAEKEASKKFTQVKT